MGFIIAAAVAAAIIAFCFLCYKKAPPTQAIVVTGFGLSRPKVVCGRGVFVLPIVQRADRLNMRLLKIDVKTPETGVKTKEGVSLWLDSVVTVQVYSENSTVSDEEVRNAGYDDIRKYINSRQQAAISNFLGMDEAHINEKINDVLQGNLREIVSEMTVDQILTNRKQMAVSVVENARPDLAKMGLEVVTFNVQDVKDAVDAMGHNHGVIEAIGVEQEELVKKRASIAKAEAERDVSCAKAAAAMAANEKEIEAQTAIAQRNNELELAKSKLKAEADKAAADANAAGMIQTNLRAKEVKESEADAEIARQKKMVDLAAQEAEVQQRKLDAEILETQSDADHPLTAQALIDLLTEKGIRAERKSIYSDMVCLQEYGLDIVQLRGPGGGYYLGSRAFELPELKLLVDAAQSSKFLSEKKSLQLITKLETLASSYEAKSLRRQVVVAGRVKTMNESIYYNVDRLHDAIAGNSQISFRYFDWDLHGERRYRPGKYTASPYALLWEDENYYLIALSPRHGLTHYRVDKMTNITKTGETRILGPEYENLDLTRYSSSVFGMFRGAPARVHLRFENALAGVVIDRFGRGVMLVPDGDAHFTLMADIAVSPQFFAWLAGFGPRVKILHPTQIAEDYVNYIKSALEPYA